MHARTACLLLIAPLALAGCSTTEEDVVEFPAFNGKRVVFVADSNASSALAFGDEVWVADTGSATFTVTRISTDFAAGSYADLPGAAGLTGPLLYRVVADISDGCPSGLRFLSRTGGQTTMVEASNYCVYDLASMGTGTGLVLFADFVSSGPSLFYLDSTNTGTVHTISLPTPSTVDHFSLPANGTSVVWAQIGGVYRSLLTPTPIAPTSVSVDDAGELFPTPDGLSVVYAAINEEQYKIVALDGSGETYLTNPLVGDTLDHSTGAATLSPDGTKLLYVVNVGGQKQLWAVSIATPLGEARADSAASLLLQAGYSIKFNPNSTRYAWTGDAGSGNQIFASTVAAPATVDTLTPTTEEPTGTLIWASNVDLVYLSSDADQGVPIGANALRSVNAALPLLTIVLGVDESVGYFHDDLTTCADGTLVFDIHADFSGDIQSAVFTASPTATASATQISPVIHSTVDEISAVSCID